MKVKVFSSQGEKGSVELPAQFNEPVRAEVIKRAVLALQSHKRQPYGADPLAGKRFSVKLSRRRRDYKGSYGKGISRVPRKTLSRNGSQMYWVGAFAPGTVGGRRAHPPKIEKVWSQKVNDKERKLAIRSALSASVLKDWVVKRGHVLPPTYPFIISNEAEELQKTKDVKSLLEKFGFEKELERTTEKKIRAGKGKNRGRPYNKKTGILLVVSQKCPLSSSARNIPGVDVVPVNAINAELLAPGTIPGRLTLYTQKAIERIQKENLFK